MCDAIVKVTIKPEEPEKLPPEPLELILKALKDDELTEDIRSEAASALRRLCLPENKSDVGGEAVQVSGVMPKGMVAFSRELADAGMSIRNLWARRDLDDELNRRGLTRPVQERVLKIASGYGGIDAFLEVLSRYETRDYVTKGAIKEMNRGEALRKENSGLERRKTELEAEVTARARELAELYGLYMLGWNLVWLIMLAQITKDYGGMKEVMEAVQKYGNEKKLAESGAPAKGPDASTPAKPPESRRVEIIPMSPWGRREYEAVIIGVLKGLNASVQEAPELPEQTKILVDKQVKMFLGMLDSLGIGGVYAGETDAGVR